MRRTALLGLAFLLPGCTGAGEFLRHVHSPPPANPNAPSADSLNLRRALGVALGFEERKRLGPSHPGRPVGKPSRLALFFSCQ